MTLCMCVCSVEKNFTKKITNSFNVMCVIPIKASVIDIGFHMWNARQFYIELDHS